MAMTQKTKDELRALRAQMRKAGNVMAEKADDATLLECPMMFDAWRPGTEYKAGVVLTHSGTLYRVQQAHTAQAHQPPDGVGMLAVYAPVQAPAPEGQVLPWVSGEAGLKPGDKRSYGDKVYECIQAPGANIWTPDTVPAIWKVVTTDG